MQASAALENEDTSIGQIRINDLSKPPTQETNIGNFQDLNISSMESSSSNEEPEAETGKACANWDPKLGLVSNLQCYVLIRNIKSSYYYANKYNQWKSERLPL